MRIITHYSESHRLMAEKYLLPSVDMFSDHIHFPADQICAEAQWMTQGWNTATAAKLFSLASLPPDGGLDLFCDADIVCKSGIVEWLESRAVNGDFILYGKDNLQWCTGTILYRRTERVVEWWKNAAITCAEIGQNDQDGIHLMRAEMLDQKIQMGTLDDQVVCNLASLGATGPWTGSRFEVPKTCLLWHANWTLGVNQKQEMLEQALKQLEKL